MTGLIKRFRQDTSGATAMEYGLIAALIGVFLITVLGLIGSRMNSKFTSVANTLK